MNPFKILLALLCCTLVSCTTTRRNPASLENSRPNIVFIITDDQGYGELSCHGNPILKTPNLDRLHAASLRFTQFHVSPTCAPTRAALLTGKHEFRSGVTHTIFERERLSLRANTLAELLQKSGYRTGIFGKWHLGDEDEFLPNRRGFDESFIHGAGGIGQTYPGSCGDAPNNTYFDPWIWHNDRFVKTSGYCTDVFFNQAADWIDRGGKKPFLAWISPNVPHDPFISPGAAWEAPYLNAGLSTNAIRYYAMIAHFDAALGRLLDHLENRKLLESTLIVFVTDNGHSVPTVYNAGMKAAKGTPYQGGIRVPSFWSWRGRIPAGVDCNALTAHLDFLPTIAQLAGRPAPPNLDGHSLLPLLQNPASPWPDRLLFTHVGRWESGDSAAHKHRGSAVRSPRYKLVNGSELYDLQEDPAESRNVIAEHPDIAANLSAAFDRWWMDVLPAALEHEMARGPDQNPFKARFYTQYGQPAGTNSWDWKLDPNLKFQRNRPRF
jgi:arylsulfatase A-like enzyme